MFDASGKRRILSAAVAKIHELHNLLTLLLSEKKKKSRGEKSRSPKMLRIEFTA